MTSGRKRRREDFSDENRDSKRHRMDPGRAPAPETRQQAQPGPDAGWQTVSRKKNRHENDRYYRQSNSSTEQPCISFHSKQTTPLGIKDLQNLVLYTLADGTAPTWLAFKNVRRCKKVVVVMVAALDVEMLEGACRPDAESGSANDPTDSEQKAREYDDFLRQLEPRRLSEEKLSDDAKPLLPVFSHILPVRCPGDSKYSRVHSPIQAMLICPTPSEPEEKKLKGSKDQSGNKHFVAVRTPITSFIHTAEELQDAEYPIHPALLKAGQGVHQIDGSGSVQQDWVASQVDSGEALQTNRPSQPHRDLSQGLRIYSIDCEMVLTTDDNYSLARISIVDWDGKIVLDSYILPSLPIKDYFTQYSGITPSHLQEVTTTLADMQSQLLQLLTPTTVLLGHSLNSDLAAMKLTHPWIIDTSMLYPHPRGLPLRSSLKYLTQKYLHREIQTNDGTGHDSVEDARAVLDLVKLKCEKGPRWGTTEAQGEPIWRRLKRAGRTGAIVDWGTPERGFGSEADVKIACSNDEEVVKGILRAVGADDGPEQTPLTIQDRPEEDESTTSLNGQPNAQDTKAVAVAVADKPSSTPYVHMSDAPPSPSSEAAAVSSNGEEARVQEKNGVDFVFARLRALEFARGWSQEPAVKPLHNHHPSQAGPSSFSSSTTATTTTAGPATHAGSDSTLHQTLSHLTTLTHTLPRSTLILLSIPQGSPMTRLTTLQAAQNTYRKELKTKRWNDEMSVQWGEKEERELRGECERVRGGWGALGVV